ncbi:hypothetical protein DL93DRAFT_2075583 [Clavulina sp. PMI_390]|nr:hypothetical protein DL93DRAFT_2075583 [Clavulina sp. PMI_390]
MEESCDSSWLNDGSMALQLQYPNQDPSLPDPLATSDILDPLWAYGVSGTAHPYDYTVYERLEAQRKGIKHPLSSLPNSPNVNFSPGANSMRNVGQHGMRIPGGMFRSPNNYIPRNATEIPTLGYSGAGLVSTMLPTDSDIALESSASNPLPNGAPHQDCVDAIITPDPNVRPGTFAAPARKPKPPTQPLPMPPTSYATPLRFDINNVDMDPTYTRPLSPAPHEDLSGGVHYAISDMVGPRRVERPDMAPSAVCEDAGYAGNGEQEPSLEAALHSVADITLTSTSNSHSSSHIDGSASPFASRSSPELSNTESSATAVDTASPIQPARPAPARPDVDASMKPYHPPWNLWAQQAADMGIKNIAHPTFIPDEHTGSEVDESDDLDAAAEIDRFYGERQPNRSNDSSASPKFDPAIGAFAGKDKVVAESPAVERSAVYTKESKQRYTSPVKSDRERKDRMLAQETHARSPSPVPRGVRLTRQVASPRKDFTKRRMSFGAAAAKRLSRKRPSFAVHSKTTLSGKMSNAHGAMLRSTDANTALDNLLKWKGRRQARDETVSVSPYSSSSSLPPSTSSASPITPDGHHLGRHAEPSVVLSDDDAEGELDDSPDMETDALKARSFRSPVDIHGFNPFAQPIRRSTRSTRPPQIKQEPAEDQFESGDDMLLEESSDDDSDVYEEEEEISVRTVRLCLVEVIHYHRY